MVEAGDVLLDIGANIGYITACFLHGVKRSEAIAIDPQPKAVELLRSNLELIDSHRHLIFAVRISDRESKAWLEIDEANYGAGKVVDRQRECDGSRLVVSATDVHGYW